METKLCNKCKINKSVSEFYKHNRDGYRTVCKPCNKTKVRKGYWPEYMKNSMNRFKHLARLRTGHAIKSGKLKRQPCQECGLIKTHAHHPDYNKPFDVLWLCSKHHREIHKNGAR